MPVPSITHEELLSRLSLAWIDLVPGRRKLPKRDLPQHAQEPSPILLVVAGPKDTTSLEIISEFLKKHLKPKYDHAHTPTGYAWQLITPTGERLLVFTWVNWRKNSRQLFETLCQESGRAYGTLTTDGLIELGTRTIPFRDCQIIQEDQLRQRPPLQVKPHPAKAIVTQAEKLLKARKSKCEELHCREFFDDAEAHDEEVQSQLEATFLSSMKTYEKALASRYGAPTRTGTDQVDQIPINGVVRYALWEIGAKTLYLAAAHEDRELAWVILLGVHLAK